MREVGGKGANDWGFYDMIGNVFEWCSDYYGSYGGDATDPKGPADGSDPVFRGGSWGADARDCRSAIRGRGWPSNRNDDLGFRHALVPVQ